MVVFRVPTFRKKVLAASSGWELGSGGCWRDWKEKYFDYVGSLQAPFPVRAK